MSTASQNSTSVLRLLHRIQRQLADLHERLDRGPRQTHAAETNVKRCEEHVTQVKAEAKALRVAVDQKQLQLKTGEEKVKELRRKLNAASSNREYQALLDQIAADEMANSVLTDEILEAMEKADAFGKNITEAEGTLLAAKQKADEVRAEVAEQEPLLRGDVTRLEGELRQAETGLPEDVVELYRRIVRQKGEDALAVVENQCCTGCNQQITLNVYSHIKLGQPVACKTCGRLLYLPE
ncbi:MAG: hypothetical protein LLG00_03525 [Planctomycetaceae bacterium]|nr:hypothetical protein [Planctomycetaceae bacterium]